MSRHIELNKIANILYPANKMPNVKGKCVDITVGLPRKPVPQGGESNADFEERLNYWRSNVGRLVGLRKQLVLAQGNVPTIPEGWLRSGTKTMA